MLRDGARLKVRKRGDKPFVADDEDEDETFESFVSAFRDFAGHDAKNSITEQPNAWSAPWRRTAVGVSVLICIAALPAIWLSQMDAAFHIGTTLWCLLHSFNGIRFLRSQTDCG